MVEARILIADDSKMNQQILSEILGDRYEYLYADDGMQALDLLHSEFDIDLLLDINMPRLDGFGVIEGVRANPDHRATPILVLTTESDAAKKERARAAGATGWIVKPFNPVKLVEAVRRVAA